MMSYTPAILTRSVVAALVACSFAPAHAQSVADFYKGKNISLAISFSVGGGYDLYARTLARHMGKYIPGNPAIVPQNMPGAGGLRVAQFFYSAAPQRRPDLRHLHAHGRHRAAVRSDPEIRQREVHLARRHHRIRSACASPGTPRR